MIRELEINCCEFFRIVTPQRTMLNASDFLSETEKSDFMVAVGIVALTVVKVTSITGDTVQGKQKFPV